MPFHISLLLLSFLMSSLAVASPLLTEFMAAGQSVIADEDGNFPDWVEIHNPDAAPLSLAGWHLSDNPAKPAKWTFPDVTVAPGGYLVVFCSERDPALPAAHPHANFRLNDGGETLALSAPDGGIVQLLTYPLQLPDLSHDGADYLANPTPGAANDGVSVAIARAPEFSEPHGFKTAGFNLTLTSGTPGAKVRYTLDGAEPNGASKPLTSPLRVAKTTVVRAAAFADGMRRSPVVTRTYLFKKDIVKQSLDGKAPAGWPRNWGANRVDYGLDPRIAARGKFASKLGAALTDIPSISIVMPLEELFDPTVGIYANPNEKGREWERAASLELIQPDGSAGFQINAGLRIRGGASRDTGNTKHSFRVLFRKQYGAEALEFPLFGAEGAQRTERFDLRCEQLVAWHYFVDPDADFIRDIYGRDTQRALGQPAKRGDFYHLYINGQYWGMYQTDERIGAEYAAENFGGSESDYDTVKINYDNDSTGGGTDFVDGTFGAWRRAVEMGFAGFESNENYFRIQGLNADGSKNPAFTPLVDVDNLIDYMLAGIFIAADDSPPAFGTQNNWYSVRSRKGKFGFRFFAHDWEISMYNGDDDRVGPQPTVNPFRNGFGGPVEIARDIISPPEPVEGLDPTSANPWHFWEAMRMNAEFRLRVADHVQRHFFNNGPLTRDNAIARWRARMDEINLAVIGESARWGDARQDDFGDAFIRNEKRKGNVRVHALAPGQDEDDGIIIDPPPRPTKPPGGGGGVGEGTKKRPKPFTRDDWLRACNENILDGFLANRTETVLGHLRAGGLFPAIPAPSAEVTGGVLVALASGIEPDDGTPPDIYYTLNGDDPRRVGGEVAPGAARYAAPFVVAKRTTLKARALHRGEWSALIEQVIEPGVDFSALRITEIHYNPADPSESEFIEIQNTGASPLNLAGLRFSAGVTFAFPATQLAPGGRVVIVGNAPAFEARHPDVPYLGQFGGRLSDDGEALTIETANAARVLSLGYDDDGQWPAAADGFGWSLVYDGGGDPDDGKNWHASDFAGGSPGADDARQLREARVVIGEIMEGGADPLLEMENHEDFPADVTGWKLRIGGAEFALPAMTVPALGRATVVLGAGAGLPLPVEGGTIALVRAPHLVGPGSEGAPGKPPRDRVHRFSFGPLFPGVSYGRYLTAENREFFPTQIAPTPGAPNAGPVQPGVRISEIHYAPPPDIVFSPDGGAVLPGVEFVEIESRSEFPIALSNARLVGLAFTFPPDAELPANGRALVVTGDPVAFRARHSVPASVAIFGPAGGALQDDGERVAIELRVVIQSLPASSILDEVRYNDRLPWPVLPPGGNYSLQRIEAPIFSAEPGAWGLAQPTPGLANKVNAPPSVSIVVGEPDEGGRLNVEVTASDADGTVRKVELLVDGIIVAEDTEAPFSFSLRLQPGLHDIAARATDDRGGTGESGAESVEVAERPDGFGRGLLASYFHGIDPTRDAAHSEVAAEIGGDWFHIPPPHRTEPGPFSATYTGTLVPRRDGIHTFNFHVAGGVRFYIGSELVLDAWADPGTYGLVHYPFAMPLSADEAYDIRVEYFDDDGLAFLRMSWSEPDSFLETTVPAALLYAPGLDPSGFGVATPAGLERRFVGREMNAQFFVLNPPGPVRWSVESGLLPPGLALSTGGVLGGIPSAAGVFTFVVKAEEAAGSPPRVATCAVTMRIVRSDVSPPRVRLLTPGRIVNHSDDLLLSGTANGPRPIAYVRYAINGNEWHALPGSEQWSVALPADALAAGDNYLQVRAEDVDGRLSEIVEPIFSRRFPGTLRVTVEGAGTVTPGFLGVTERIIGNTYSITAKPAPGYILSHWEGAGFGRDERLFFAMVEDMEITAVFAPNPFLGAGGRFDGFLGEDQHSHVQRGRMAVSVAETGAFTGWVEFIGVRHSIRGRFDLNGQAYAYASSPDGSRFLNVNMVLGGSTISAVIFGGIGDIYESAAGDLSRVPWSPSEPCPQRGRWTLRMPAADGQDGIPAGTPHAAINVRADGSVRVLGRLPVGGGFTMGGRVAENGTLAFYAAPAPDESVSGPLSFRTTRDPRASGALVWAKARLPEFSKGGGLPLRIIPPPEEEERDIFVRELAADATQYRAPGPNQLILGYAAAQLLLTGDEVDFQKRARLMPDHAFEFRKPDANRSELSADPLTGLARGSLAIEGSRWKLHGVVDSPGDVIVGFGAGPDLRTTEFRVEPSVAPAQPAVR